MSATYRGNTIATNATSLIRTVSNISYNNVINLVSVAPGATIGLGCMGRKNPDVRYFLSITRITDDSSGDKLSLKVEQWGGT